MKYSISALFVLLCMGLAAVDNTSLDVDPSAIVHSSVNAMTGDLFVSEVDLTVKGHEPIHLKRLFVSHTPKGAWGYWDLHPYLQLQFHTEEGRALVPLSSGTVLTYYSPSNTEQALQKVVFQPKLPIGQICGIANSSRGELSARTNIKNMQVHLLTDQQEFRVYDPNGTERCYGLSKTEGGGGALRLFKLQGSHFSNFHLLWEKLPNGNRIFYSYNKENQLTEIKTTNPQGDHTYAWVKIQSLKEKGLVTEFVLETSDAKTLCYRFKPYKKRDSLDGYTLEKISYGDFEERIRYTSSPELGQMLSQRTFLDGRSLSTSYYTDSSDPLSLGRVKQLYTPTSQTTLLYSTQETGEGCTEVIESDGSKRIFRYTSSCNLKMIEHYDREAQLLFIERLAWDPSNASILLARSYIDKDRQPSLCRRFWYDESGNVALEKCYGNLSGECAAILTLNEEGLPEENGVESYAKRYIYSEDGRNLLLKTEEDNGTAVYLSYHPNAVLLASKLSLQEGMIKRREFFEYNDDLILVDKILDNGSSSNKDSLAGVTVRKITRFTPRTQEPFIGLPHRIEERYLDLEQHEERLLKRTDLTYSKNGLIIEEQVYDATNTYAYTLHTRYDEMGRVIERTNAIGQTVKPPPSSQNDHRKTVDDCFGIYNARASLTQKIFADGSSEKFLYYLDGSLKKAVNAEGVQIEYQYDFSGRKILTRIFSMNDEFMSQESAEYDAFNLLTKTDPEGNTTQFFYDGAGRKIAEELDNEKVLYDYDALGRVSCITKGECYGCVQKGQYSVQQFTRMSYDLLDRVIEERIEDEGGTLHAHTLFAYDSAGNLSCITRFIDGVEAKERFVYDSLGRLIRHIDALGQISQVEYHEELLQKTHTNAQGIQTIETSDPFGRLLSIEQNDALGLLLMKRAFSYDAEGNLSMEVSTHRSDVGPYTCETRWEYEACHRPITLIENFASPQERTTRFVYTPRGQLSQKIKPDGVILHYAYNALGDLTQLSSSDGSIDYAFHYDKMGRLIGTLNGKDGRTSFLSFDGHGRVISELQENGLALQNQYDKLGRRVELTLSDRSSIHFTYDALYLRKITRNTGTGTLLYHHYFQQYDLAGNLLKERFAGGVGKATHTFDALGRKSSSTYAWGEHKALSYDAFGRLSQALSILYTNPTEEKQYSLCDLESVVRPLDPLQSTSADFCQYDANGNVLRKQLNEGEVFCRYDALDRLVEIEKFGSWRHCYTYDALDRRQEKIRYAWQREQWNEIERLSFLYDGQEEIAAVDASGQYTQVKVLTPISHTLSGNLRKFSSRLYEKCGVSPYSTVAIELSGKIYIPFHDLYGNICGLHSLRTHGAVETYSYNFFGAPETASQLNQPWGLLAQRFDEETGLVRFGKRYYDPRDGQWFSPKPTLFPTPKKSKLGLPPRSIPIHHDNIPMPAME